MTAKSAAPTNNERAFGFIFCKSDTDLRMPPSRSAASFDSGEPAA
jgi:hypothetical protein